jgi:hypothetical protein
MTNSSNYVAARYHRRDENRHNMMLWSFSSANH